MAPDKVYGFRFKGEVQQRIAGLHTIGKESRTSHTYSWDGLKRQEQDRIVFQYTLNGQGRIRIKDNVYTLTKNEAFLINIPSDHCYYLPSDSDHWDFIFITLYGEEAARHYHTITHKHGHIFTMPIDTRPIRHIFKIIEIIETIGIKDAFEASGYAYSFLMEYLHYLEFKQQQQSERPASINKAVAFIKAQYAKDISLDNIVKVSGLSKYHFTRLFTRTLHKTPVQYLTKVRIEQALQLLRHTDQSIDEIAKTVGYASHNYFSKVFKATLGETPTQYRQNKFVMPVDRLFID
ncbi:AraC-type DNA-binding protein [Amphibacillus marinus]|uniref:AraC-type DNA-binding protein n=1 Tax=Amphibacillus marinus TaxID=872970 RepID=A0A1H8KJ61_9BACI|nr:AraC family transcriptional regulator [Amphibacillus marinus]SEN93003.1 AraC-type DNA-binding protein [Amphibacillus marinus]